MKYIINKDAQPLTFHLPHERIKDMTRCNITIGGAWQYTNERPKLATMVCYGCQTRKQIARNKLVAWWRK